MKRVLIMLNWESSANGICINKLIESLHENNFKALCIADQCYVESEAGTIQGVHIHRIKPPFNSKIQAWRNRHPGKTAKLVILFFRALSKIKLFLSIPVMPLRHPLYAWRFYRQASRLYKQQAFDCIIPVFSPFESLLAGHYFKKKHPEVKLIPYFLDAFSGSAVPRFFTEETARKKKLRWERKLLENADKIIYMKSSREHYEKYSRNEPHYPRMQALDIPLIAELKSGKETNADKFIDRTKINLVYAGSLATHVRKPDYFLKVFKRINIPGCVFTLIVPHNYEGPPLEESEINPVKIYTRIHHNTVIHVMKSTDILVNFGNNVPTMVPSKIFEYMSLGKPIISTYSIDNDSCIPYLKKYPLALLLKEDFNHLEQDAKTVEAFIHEMRNQTLDFKKLKDSFYLNTPQAFVDSIKETLK